MAVKYIEAKNLYDYTLPLITKSEQNYLYFLESVANNYKYSFSDQLMIYNQKPFAAACASYEFWNKQMGRSVNAGTKGIALLREGNRGGYIEYVFDVSDTTNRAKTDKYTQKLWKYEDDKHHDEVCEALTNSFGEVVDEPIDFSDFIAHISYNAVNDNYQDYFEDLKTLLGVSDEIALLSLEKDFIEAVHISTTFVVGKRLGLYDNETFLKQDYRFLDSFKGIEGVTALGNAVSDTSELILREIEKTVRAYDTLAQSKSIRDNAVERTNKTQGGINNERTDIQSSERISASEHSGGGQSLPDWQVRNDEVKLPKEQSQGDLLNHADERNVILSPKGDRQYRKKADRNDGIENGGDRKRERDLEGKRPDEMGGADEQLQSLGRRDSIEGNSVQLEYYNRKTEDKSLPFFHLDEKIKEILKTTPHLKASEEDISLFFAMHEDSDERTEFIKEIFNDDYTELLLESNERVGYKTYQNVLQLWEGSYLSRTSQGFYNWGVIVNYYEGMLLLGEYGNKTLLADIPSEETQISMIEQAEKERNTKFTFPQEFIDCVLQRGGYFHEGKYRIYQFYEGNPTKKEAISFLKKEYGIGGHSPVIIGTHISEMHDAKGIELIRRNGIDPNDKIMLTWDKVDSRFRELIKLDRYLNPKEKELYPAYLEREEKRKAELEEERYAREILSSAPPISNENKIYDIKLNDTIYIGSDEYNLEEMGEEVLLRNIQFPLFIKRLSKDELDKFLKENDLNDHLIASKIEKQEEERSEIEALEEAEVAEISEDNVSPLWQQYQKSKEEYPNSITALQVGDFYEFYDDDAKIASLFLSLSMTSKTINAQRVDMCGIPSHLLETALNKLNDAGYDVAINEKQPNGEYKVYNLITLHKKEQEIPTESKENPLIGRELTIDDRKFVVESIRDFSGEVSLKDVTFEDSVGFPINRIEKLNFIERMIKEADTPPKIDFVIHDNNLGVGGAKQKFVWNIEAIKLLKALESENRLATHEEQEILSRYVGWGGIPQAFDEANADWEKEYAELKELLSGDEYISARSSTLNAHYTSPIVIKAMYSALDSFGFKTGNILEPACGIGNFFGLLPGTMKDSKLYGIELDSITGRIAKQLYQTASIEIKG